MLADIRSFLSRRRVKYPLVALGVVLLGWLAFLWVFTRGLPSTDALLAYEPPLPTNVRAYDGTPIYSFARERRVQLAYDEFPPRLVQAFLSAEDKSFFTHHGIDWPAFANAVYEYVTRYGSGQRAHGGSTITQQIAKNLLANDAYSPTRKIREAIVAFRIERALSKQQILELYLNQIFLGRNAYGVQSAARAYFGRDVTDLSLPQMAYLATLPKAPRNYSPEHHQDAALERRAYVLREMRLNGYITPAEEQAADAAPLDTVPRGDMRREIEQKNEGYFTEAVRRELIARYGETAQAGPNSVYDGGLWVRSSLDPTVQAAAERALRDGLVRYEGARGWSGRLGVVDPDGDWRGQLAALRVGTGYPEWRVAAVLARDTGMARLGFVDGSTGQMPPWLAAAPKLGVGGRSFDFLKRGDVIVVMRNGQWWQLESIPRVSGGFVAENPHTGQVLAMQGGFDARAGAFNRATQALRQPGSSFKPFVYAAALDAGLTPATRIIDGPFCVDQGQLGRKCFRNFSGGYAGPQTMRWGVEQSRNLMTVRTASQIGMRKVTAVADAMGVGRYPPYLAYSLGAGETTVLHMVNAYAEFANQGRKLTPTIIDYVQDRHGKVIWRADPRPCEGCNMAVWNGQPMPRPRLRSAQAVDAMTAYQVVHILEGVVQRGTATVLRDVGRPLFGKTGTSTGPTNVWFVGGSADLVGGVYLGYDKPRSLGGGAEGGTVAAPIFRQFALAAMKDMPIVPFRAPAGIRMVRIDRRSGQRVFGGWPGDDPKAAVIWEAFKPATEPRRAIRAADAAAPKAKAAPKAQTDSDFLANQGGIY